jgi:hypothetical protein
MDQAFGAGIGVLDEAKTSKVWRELTIDVTSIRLVDQ